MEPASGTDTGRRGRPALTVALVLVLLVAALAGSWLFDRHWRLEYDETVERLLSEGKLLSLEDLLARAHDLPPLDRRISNDEYAEAVRLAQEAGLRLDERRPRLMWLWR